MIKTQIDCTLQNSVQDIKLMAAQTTLASPRISFMLLVGVQKLRHKVFISCRICAKHKRKWRNRLGPACSCPSPHTTTESCAIHKPSSAFTEFSNPVNTTHNYCKTNSQKTNTRETPNTFQRLHHANTPNQQIHTSFSALIHL